MNGFESLGLVVGHLLGDYILQPDRIAANKSNPWPGPRPEFPVREAEGNVWTRPEFQAEALAYDRARGAWDAADRAWRVGHRACTLHCALYTLAVWLCACWWMPWWGAAACFLAHWPLDRFRLARVWMTRVAGQSAFAGGPLAPWVVVADNAFHMLTLFLIALAAVGVRP